MGEIVAFCTIICAIVPFIRNIVNNYKKARLVTTQIHEISSSMCIQEFPTIQCLYREFEKKLNHYKGLNTIQSRDDIIQIMLYLGIFNEDKNGKKSFIFFSDILEELNKEYYDNVYKPSLTDSLFQNNENGVVFNNIKRIRHDEIQQRVFIDKFMKEFDKFKDSFIVNYEKKIRNYLKNNK